MARDDPDREAVTAGDVAREAAFPHVHARSLARPGQRHPHHLPIGEVVAGRDGAVEQLNGDLAGG